MLQRFRSADGFWYDPTLATLTIALTSPGGVAVPFVFNASTGLEFAASDIDTHQAVDNQGDAPTWPTVRIFGPGDDPIVENETMGPQIDLTGLSLAAGDYVDINMQARAIYKYTAIGATYLSILASRSATSDFFYFCPGENILHITMNDITTGSVVVTWYNRYRSGL